MTLDFIKAIVSQNFEHEKSRSKMLRLYGTVLLSPNDPDYEELSDTALQRFSPAVCQLWHNGQDPAPH